MKTKHLLSLLLAAGITSTLAGEAETSKPARVTKPVVEARKKPAAKTLADTTSVRRTPGSLCDSTACRALRFAWSPTAPGS
jgi:hypothetical protein